MPTTTNPQPLATRKLFNCIVDDTALIAGLKKSTRDGIKKWVHNGSVRLFVPLHTLERLRGLAQNNDRFKHDARETLQWLDEVTSLPKDAPNGKVAELVHLQGGFEVYDDWTTVEEFMLPETLLSMETESQDDSIEGSLADLHIDALPDHASACSQESLEVRTASPVSNHSFPSPGLRTASPYNEAKLLPQPIGTGRPSHKKSNSNVSAASTESTGKKSGRRVPKTLRPFFNYILWRIHQEENATAALESFILVTNDSLKHQIAHRFGIRVRRLEQMREIIGREERDIKNRAEMLKKELEAETDASSKFKATLQNSDDEDEIVFKRTPPKAPQAMTKGRTMDPNAFSRNTQGPARGPRGALRGRGGQVRGNYAPPRAMAPAAPRAPPVDLSRPIDPDSFSRATVAKPVARGGRRHLWEPA